MQCDKCGNQLDPNGGKFCPNCGTKINLSPVAPEKKSPENPSTEGVPSFDTTSSTAADSRLEDLFTEAMDADILGTPKPAKEEPSVAQEAPKFQQTPQKVAFEEAPKFQQTPQKPAFEEAPKFQQASQQQQAFQQQNFQQPPNNQQFQQAPAFGGSYGSPTPQRDSLGLFENFKYCMTQRYADFKGRATRGEFWKFALFQLIFSLIAMLPLIPLLVKPEALLMSMFGPIQIAGLVIAIVSLFLFIPSLSLYVRRLHDINKSGWWVLIQLIPLIGPLVLLYFFVIKGTEGPNNYGAPNSYENLSPKVAKKKAAIISLSPYIVLFVAYALVAVISFTMASSLSNTKVKDSDFDIDVPVEKFDNSNTTTSNVSPVDVKRQLFDIGKEEEAINTEITNLASRINNSTNNYGKLQNLYQDITNYKNHIQEINDQATSLQSQKITNQVQRQQADYLKKLTDLEIIRIQALQDGVKALIEGRDASAYFQKGTKASYEYDDVSDAYGKTFNN